jgi:hypothetical protein
MANTKASPNPVDFPTRAELPAAVYRPENSVSKASRTSALFLDSIVSLAIFVFAICRPSSFIRAIAADASKASVP